MSNTVALVLASSFLVSCGDSEEQKPVEEPKPAVEAPVPAPVVEEAPDPQIAIDAAKAELFDTLLYTSMKTMSKYATQPLFTETVRTSLEKMQNYYDLLPSDAGVERVKLGLAIADTCRDMTAYARAGAMYEAALSAMDALPQDAQDSNEMKVIKSSLFNGIASSKLMNPATKGEAAAYYDKQLALDKAMFDALVSADGVATMTPEISTAASNLISSYRCKGDCLVFTDELEDARDTYKKAVELSKVIKSPTAPIMLEFVKLLTALGDLENKCGNDLAAAQAWGGAALNCRQLFNGTQNQATKLECKRYFDRLAPLIKEKTDAIKAANPDAAAPAADAAPLE